jgi:hypothetical protein
MLATRSSAASKPTRSSAQLKQKGSNAQRNGGNDQDEEDDLIEQLNRKLSNVTLNPSTNIPDEMNITDISTMVRHFQKECTGGFLLFLFIAPYFIPHRLDASIQYLLFPYTPQDPPSTAMHFPVMSGTKGVLHAGWAPWTTLRERVLV